MNLYRVMAGNPVRYTDPTGEIAPLIVLGVCVGAAFVGTAGNVGAPTRADEGVRPVQADVVIENTVVGGVIGSGVVAAGVVARVAVPRAAAGAVAAVGIGRRLIRGKAPAQSCFPPDTLVSTETGLRAIVQVVPGDRVWAFDFSYGEWRLCGVEARHDNEYVGQLVTLDVGVGEVTATAYHPFWVVSGDGLDARPVCRELTPEENQGGKLGGRWVNSHEVREGDVVLLRGHGPAPVRRFALRAARTPVCNLTVRDHHTFAVGEAQLLVHNRPSSR